MENENFEIIRYLGIDWGEARIGLALADSELKLAIPFKVVKNIDEILAVIKEEEIDVLVIGSPSKMMNEKGEVENKKFLLFLKEMQETISQKIELVDERLTSKAADALSGDKKTKASRDALAAMIILQNFLDNK